VPLKVKTETGNRDVKTEGSQRGRFFSGIPYASAPVGGTSLEAPAPASHEPACGKRTEFGARCIQGKVYDDIWCFRDAGPKRRRPDAKRVDSRKDAKAKLPVMFWNLRSDVSLRGNLRNRAGWRDLFLTREGARSFDTTPAWIFGFFALPY